MEQSRAPGTSAADNEEYLQDRSEGVVPLTDHAEETPALGASDSGPCGGSTGAEACEGDEPPSLVVGGVPGASVDATLHENATETGEGARSDLRNYKPPGVIDRDCGTPARVSALGRCQRQAVDPLVQTCRSRGGGFGGYCLGSIDAHIS